MIKTEMIGNDVTPIEAIPRTKIRHGTNRAAAAVERRGIRWANAPRSVSDDGVDRVGD